MDDLKFHSSDLTKYNCQLLTWKNEKVHLIIGKINNSIHFSAFYSSVSTLDSTSECKTF